MNMHTGTSTWLKAGRFQQQVQEKLRFLTEINFSQRLWNGDNTLWPKGSESEASGSMVGWLDVPERMLNALEEVESFAVNARLSGFTHAVLLGMGGSSLTPYVFSQVFHTDPERLKLIVLDTTDPETIAKAANEIHIPSTLFIVSSKSGTTAEIIALFRYFYGQVYRIKGQRSGENFIAITDEGSPLSGLARRMTFRHTFINFPNIGGRFSALSYFGIVPAALMGVPVREILTRCREMMKQCGPETPVEENPGLALGAALAALAQNGCDKLACRTTPELRSFILWLEQLLAESTGKNGKGILPFSDNPSVQNVSYGEDTALLQFGIKQEQETPSQRMSYFASKENPVFDLRINDLLDIGKELFRWEIATATAGSLLELDPFDQPNVQESKKQTEKILKKIQKEGKLPGLEPALAENNLLFYPSRKPNSRSPLKGLKLMETFLASLKPGDYVALLAYLPENTKTDNALADIQAILHNNLHVTVTTQYGPRYLHSTGQFHKGGPENGFFIQFSCRTTLELPIPGNPYTFDLLKKAQAMGDREALLKCKRKVILIGMESDALNGLEAFKNIAIDLHPAAGRMRKNKFTELTTGTPQVDPETESKEQDKAKDTNAQ